MLHDGDNMTSIKRANRSTALHILHEKGMISRKRLAEEMKLTPAAITKIVAELIDDGLVSEGSVVSSSSAGRREILIGLNSSAHFSLGILMNISTAVISATDLNGKVLFSEKIRLERKAPADAALEMLCSRLLELCSENSLDTALCIGVGIAVRGIISSDHRYIKNSYSVLDTANYPICDKVESLTGIPAILENNVRALFCAQNFLSPAPDIATQFFLRCEYGIGAALSVNGQIIEGSTGQCSEIGHIPYMRRGGKPCVCGKCGCLETVASPVAIIEDSKAILSPDKTPLLWNKALKKGADNLLFEDIVDSARDGDPGTLEIVEKAIIALSGALKSLIYLIDPGKIVLYGRMFDEPYCLSLLQTEMNIGVDASHRVLVEKSEFNRELEYCAAGILAVDNYFNNGGYLNDNP